MTTCTKKKALTTRTTLRMRGRQAVRKLLILGLQAMLSGRRVPAGARTSKAMIQFNNAMLIGNSLKQLVQSDLKTIKL